MTVETATKISQLLATNPPGTDPKSEGDNHLRLIKGTLQSCFDDSGTTIKTILPIESPNGAKLGNTTVTGTLGITGDVTQTGNLSVTGNVGVTGTTTLAATTVTGDLAVSGKATANIVHSTAAAELPAGFKDLGGDNTLGFDWTGVGMLELHVDASNMGSVLTTVNSPTSAAGYAKLASGLIVQWGAQVADANGNCTIVFPTAFINGVGAVLSNTNTGTGIPAGNSYVNHICNLVNTSVTVQARGIASGGGVGVHAGAYINWSAIGF